MNKYTARKGDICRWSYGKVHYAQEYDGQQWSKPVPLKDLSSVDPVLYTHVMRPDEEPERYEVVRSIKRHRKKFYREKT